MIQSADASWNTALQVAATVRGSKEKTKPVPKESTTSNRVMADIEFVRHLASRQRMLNHDEQIEIAKQIFRLRVAFQRICIREPRVVEYLIEKIQLLHDRKQRIDSICEVAMNNVSRRKMIRSKVGANLPIIVGLSKSKPCSGNSRRTVSKLVRLIEELAIRNRHFLDSPFENPKAFELLKRYEEKCQEMVLGNLWLAISVASKICHKNQAALPDMVQEAVRGLMQAATKFDFRRGIRFSTYATPWIKQAILATLPNHYRNIRIPLYFERLVRKIKKKAEVSQLRWDEDSPRIENCIANDTGVSREDARRIVVADRGTQSLDSELQGSDGSRTRSSLLEDYRCEDPYVVAEESEVSEKIKSCLSVLSEQEEMVVSLHFGFGAGKPMTLSEIGRVKGLSRERIRQVFWKALKLLKPVLEEAKLAPSFV